MKIEEVTVTDILAGKNWKLIGGEDAFYSNSYSSDQLEIEEAEIFAEDDYIAYSGVSVARSGAARPLLLIKRFGDIDYGGEYLELKEAGWRIVGIEADPDAEFRFEYMANPLEADPSFDSDDGQFRDHHREQFLLHSRALSHETLTRRSASKASSNRESAG